MASAGWIFPALRGGVRMIDEERDFPDLMTRGEVAKAFRVHPETVTRWAAAGRLDPVRTLGNHRRYRRDQVAALLEGGGPDAS